jgi:very-short-patch-repair endonuclease
VAPDRRPPGHHAGPDHTIARLAAGQHGIVTLAQLQDCGLTRSAVYKRTRRGRLHLVHPAVFAVGHPELSRDGRRLAAVLSCGNGAVLSHGSAADAWGLLNGGPARWQVLVHHDSGGLKGPDAVRRRHTRRLPPEDRTALRGIPITTVARTLLDVAGEQRGRFVQRAVHEAEVQRLLDVEAVLATIDRNPGRRGTRLLRQALGVSAADPTNSRFTAAFRRLCARHGLPAPRTNVQLDIGERLAECDAVFDDARVIVELDGERVHNTRQKFHTDRRRDTALAARGWIVIRLTWHRVTREAPTVAAELREILTLRSRVAPHGVP